MRFEQIQQLCRITDFPEMLLVRLSVRGGGFHLHLQRFALPLVLFTIGRLLSWLRCPLTTQYFGSKRASGDKKVKACILVVTVLCTIFTCSWCTDWMILFLFFHCLNTEDVLIGLIGCNYDPTWCRQQVWISNGNLCAVGWLCGNRFAGLRNGKCEWSLLFEALELRTWSSCWICGMVDKNIVPFANLLISSAPTDS